MDLEKQIERQCDQQSADSMEETGALVCIVNKEDKRLGGVISIDTQGIVQETKSL